MLMRLNHRRNAKAGAASAEAVEVAGKAVSAVVEAEVAAVREARAASVVVVVAGAAEKVVSAVVAAAVVVVAAVAIDNSRAA